MNTKKVEADFQLLATSIVSLDIKNTFLSYDERTPGKKEIDVGYYVRDMKSDEKLDKRLGALDLKIVVTSEMENQRFSVELIYRGFFSAPNHMEEQLFEKMLRLNGCASLYSMARAAVCSISSQMFSVGNIVLPLVNFVRFHEIESETGEIGVTE